MRYNRLVMWTMLASVPAGAVAQVSHTPLPPVPAMAPLYPVQKARRLSVPAPRPVIVAARPAPVRPAAVFVSAPAPVPAVVATAPAVLAPAVAAPMPAPIPVQAVLRTAAVLPANTEVVLRLDEEVNSEGRKVGAPFRLTVAKNVVHQGVVVIATGTPAFGKVSWRTGKGSFGKSGKIAITVDQLQLQGRSVRLLGEFREEGRGRTGLTIGMAVAAGFVAAAFVHGHEAAFHAGRELRVQTAEPIEFDTGGLQAPLQLVSMGTAGR